MQAKGILFRARNARSLREEEIERQLRGSNWVVVLKMDNERQAFLLLALNYFYFCTFVCF